MDDPRLQDYARLLVETCVDVQPGWQVLVVGSHLGRPLLDEVTRQIGRKGAYALVRQNIIGSRVWLRAAPIELVRKGAPSDLRTLDEIDAMIVVEAPENTRDLTLVPAEKISAAQSAVRPAYERVFNHELPWVGCQYPTPALAQEAGMSLAQFEDFLYGACLLDWDVERERMSRFAQRFEEAEEVRVVGEGTDLRLNVAGRRFQVDAGGANMPGGEFFTSPVEDSAEGEVSFVEFPATYLGREVQGIRLRFEGGKVVDASADVNQEYLVEVLDRDEGARRLGELGIGCNPGITRHMKNTLFDEKIDGTVHFALGNGLPDVGGTNQSQIHWDIVKDMRRDGTRIELDGAVVQESGNWQL